MMKQQRRRGCWAMLERAVLVLELPTVFSAAVVAALLAFTHDKAAAGLLLLLIAALDALWWAALTRRD